LLTKPLALPQNAFYGRKTELAMIKHSFDVMMEGRSQACVLAISGYAGVGKTTLLRQLTNPLTESNGYMITCKFDQTGPPDCVIANAFDAFFEQIVLSGDPHTKEDIKSCIEEALGEDVQALLESIPNLRALLEREDATDSISGDSRVLPMRWKFQLSNLIQAISRRSHPCIIMFEDLHWADESTLDTLQTIVLESKIRHCLYCMSYRNTKSEQGIQQMLDGIQDQGAHIWNIKLGPMGKEAIDCLVSETLCMPPTIIEPLSTIIRNKTGGVILFAASLLKSLHEQGLIYFDLTSLRFVFDLEKIESQEVSGDIVNYLSERILRLPRHFQAGLKVAACLGSSFAMKSFEKANNLTKDTSNEFFSMATENGFLRESAFNQYGWTHDQLQQAAYSLIPQDRRESTHLLVGSRIYLSTADSDDIYSMIHDIVRNMNYGITLIETDAQKKELARLNLVAAEKAKKTSAFSTSSSYLLTAISLIGPEWYNDSYDMGMKIFNLASEMLIVTGQSSLFNSTVEQPITRARNFADRMPAYHNLVRFLVSLGRFEDSLETCFSVLREFGEEFPTEVTDEIIQEELVKTEAALANFPRLGTLALPPLTDPMKQWLLKTMSSTMLMLFSTKTEFAPLIGCRMVQKSVEYNGWCSDSAFGLYCFGQALLRSHKVDDGCFWGKAGITLLKETNARSHLPVLETLYHGYLSFWKAPLQATSAALIDTHQQNLFEGQIEFAMSSVLHSCRQIFMCGNLLAEVHTACILVSNKMAQLKQMWSLRFHVSQHCLVLRLMGNADVSQAFAPFNGDLNTEDELLDRGIETGQQTLVQYIYLYRLIFAYWIHSFDVAAELADLYGNHHMRFLDIYYIFYRGLTALHLAQRKDGNEARWVEKVEQAVSTFEKWETYSNWNFENKYLLLSAGLHFIRGEYDQAESKYLMSCRSAGNHKFLHEEGLAMELLGIFYKERGRKLDALTYFLSARVCYQKWGAVAIVARLDLLLSTY
jgi:predicted ATPase